MVFGLLLPFLEVVLHTVTEYQRKDGTPTGNEGSRPAYAELRLNSSAGNMCRFEKGKDEDEDKETSSPLLR